MNTYPVKFFGVELNRINSIDDATAAVENFCRRATPAEVATARKLSVYDRRAYQQINRLLWSLHFEFDDPAWDARFRLLNAGL